jgi:hypothetical protein
MHIMHILHTKLTCVEQNRALLDTLCLHQSNNNQRHICIYTTLLFGHTKHPIPFDMRKDEADFPCAACDKTKDGSDGCRWCYVNSWALGWGIKQ